MGNGLDVALGAQPRMFVAPRKTCARGNDNNTLRQLDPRSRSESIRHPVEHALARGEENHVDAACGRGRERLVTFGRFGDERQGSIRLSKAFSLILPVSFCRESSDPQNMLARSATAPHAAASGPKIRAFENIDGGI